ncbi:50S ribosomal protein L10 [candidate division KSB1 bacterium]|nr:50S ribosomal protein L10 [candidate division KSB1 bacterium]
MLRPEKAQRVEDVSEKLKAAKSFYLTDFSGLNVEEISALRKKLRSASVDYHVIKNTLARIAVKNQGFSALLSYIEGPTAIAFANEEPTAPVKIINEFLKQNKQKENPKIKACVFEGEIFGADRIEEIANLPSREVLLSMLVGGLNGTLSALVYILDGLMSKMVRTIKAIEDKKKES